MRESFVPPNVFSDGASEDKGRRIQAPEDSKNSDTPMAVDDAGLKSTPDVMVEISMDSDDDDRDSFDDMYLTLPSDKAQETSSRLGSSSDDLFFDAQIDVDIDLEARNAVSQGPAHTVVFTRDIGRDNRSTSIFKTPAVVDLDLSHSIDGMYRILDLISEQGSGGFVDKVIIAQDSLQEFINTLCPGAYSSLTKVDYKALDGLDVRPVGLYGSKAEIVRFMQAINLVDDRIASLLLAVKESPDNSKPFLRSGLYILRPLRTGNIHGQLFVVYWPQETTWDDSAVTSTRRNRITFMRYLTKICDQIFALISQQHSEALVWVDEEEESMTVDGDDEESDRLFTFEVAKTNEQEENVSIRPGFRMTCGQICVADKHIEHASTDVQYMPRLLLGEVMQGFMTCNYIPPCRRSDTIHPTLSRLALSKILASGTICLNPQLGDSAIEMLQDGGLRRRFPQESHNWSQCRERARREMDAEVKQQAAAINERFESDAEQLKYTLHYVVSHSLQDMYPTLNIDQDATPGTEEHSNGLAQYADLVALYPQIDDVVQKAIREAGTQIKSRDFRSKKEHLIMFLVLQEQVDMSRAQRQELFRLVVEAGNISPGARTMLDELIKQDHVPSNESTWRSPAKWLPQVVVRNFWTDKDYRKSLSTKYIQHAREIASSTRDSDFLTGLVIDDDMLRPAFLEAKQLAQSYYEAAIPQIVEKLFHGVRHTQQDFCMKQVHREAYSRREQMYDKLRKDFVSTIEDQSRSSPDPCTHVIDSIDVQRRYGEDFYRLSGRSEWLEQSSLEYVVHILRLTAEHRHNLQLNPSFMPQPSVHERFAHKFHLPLDHEINHAQLLENEKLLLAITDGHGKLFIYLEAVTELDGAINRGRYKKLLHRDKIGQDFMLTYDESKRMLALCSSMKLHVFVFDENFGALQALGSAINLSTWYPDQSITHCHISFICGAEEVVLVDSSAQARVFSLITLQFRPAVLHLQQVPDMIYSSPDGSCILIAYSVDSKPLLVAYHWSTFGFTAGISLGSLDLPTADHLVLTSFNRRSTHLITLDIKTHQCQSVVLDITHKVTEFMFKEKGSKSITHESSDNTVHNCLIDCHAEVWTRFPVLPAVRRHTISGSSSRCSKSLTFVTNSGQQPFASHFSSMIQAFERSTRKPTGDELRSICISCISFTAMAVQCDIEYMIEKISRFRVGEWLVNLLCMIPIHIAITKENRFIPLKDGVSSAELEKSLLGAQVGRIVDSLSFGWYESIFQSYMVSKPVKVVSSMGEQSVGKSFALNHLVDTSFAGSAMRTTEGVWMSVTPTDDTLIVALDFEGVHSIERSAQEDTLLVLFNTAISNLVLFRNNFALSRDITGLFQSFQSSSTVLDPSANPMLFQSTLVIIIKDVVDSDKREITKEFSLKFQRLVETEQDANFISRLHSGKLDIIPWPVIESKEFYKLFPVLKKRLDQQAITHHSAGEFLNILKTLMAKLKANDWGALSHTMAAHRAQLIKSLLLNALLTGYAEVDPELEPLKNFDTDVVLDKPDTPTRFSLAGSQDADGERVLRSLCDQWEHKGTRQQTEDALWVPELSEYLNNLVEMRIEHVQEWIAVNFARFQEGHANHMDDLRRTFEGASVDLRASVQLCRAQCTECYLLCIQSRLHVGAHSCQTSHECINSCDYCLDEAEQKGCTMSAGHPGKHICVVNAHLCGEPCKLAGKRGCLEDCTKVVGHSGDDHFCAASVHMCGEPCDLSGIVLADGAQHTCPGTCCIPCGTDHDQHVCDARMCPVACQLCKRLCANTDHLHGLQHGAIHLCGQEHSCTALCKAPGICQIDTTPQSIEATFTGRHETFQYTKYSQVAKRLKCVKPIPPGKISHPGPHSHTADDNGFHYCETRCENCGYYCTLPLGHPQQEHETSHGSMSQTRWVVDGPDGTAVELRGRKYSSNDEGAPMMCNLVCLAMGRHVHVDYCRTVDGTPCDGAEVQHIPTRMAPNPNRPKDYITHNLHWRRSGFKDPYPRDDQATFAKCDAMCGGPEHAQNQPSFCTLPMFHPARDPRVPVTGLGYVSNDGHFFSCNNPVVMQQAFHVIFVVDRSGSMSASDRRPLDNTPVTVTIRRQSNNRLGAVYSALYGFWSARHTAITSGLQPAARQDAYSIILFDHSISNVLTNDFARSPQELLDSVLPYGSGGGTNFTAALRSAQTVMEQHFSTQRTPVIIFLSDGECQVADQIVQDLCRSAVSRGKPLSFHAVSFGQDSQSSYLRRMAQIAHDAQNSAPRDPLAPAGATVLSSYSQALDTVRLAETFLGIADSLRKTRGSLLR
ncbi:hypothetical protein SCP_0409400 [Sparassis crispa]|uniref:VWFA domain-containing protein n=1 Tax=Sparassis crispa TaxID=139825 RepID=A0A401GK61_9APHY|nr:hypothetical protein SCP_0409400 [Sparassis crispa]GBE82556.1 hypothetical protein SCP_0409400 [Sparassis crispa]